MIRGKKPSWVSDIALKRIEKLFGLAESNKKAHPERSRRYVELARKISERHNVRLSKFQKRKFCKKCSSFFTSENSKTRITPKTKATVRVCLACGLRRSYL